MRRVILAIGLVIAANVVATLFAAATFDPAVTWAQEQQQEPRIVPMNVMPIALDSTDLVFLDEHWSKVNYESDPRAAICVYGDYLGEYQVSAEMLLPSTSLPECPPGDLIGLIILLRRSEIPRALWMGDDPGPGRAAAIFACQALQAGHNEVNEALRALMFFGDRNRHERRILFGCAMQNPLYELRKNEHRG